jgi:hypothetical protein
LNLFLVKENKLIIFGEQKLNWFLTRIQPIGGKKTRKVRKNIACASRKSTKQERKWLQ